MSNPEQNVFNDVDKLQLAIAEEERKRPRDLKEEPLNAQVSYVIDPQHLPREHANLTDLLDRLREKFSLTFDESELRRLVGAKEATAEQLMGHFLSLDEDWDFRNGMLRVEQPTPRTTPVSQLKITDEAIAASVVGSTSEADYVVQRCAEELWRSAGAESATWKQIEEHVQLRGCKTATRVQLGLDLVDFLSEKVRKFLDASVSSASGMAVHMGKHPVRPRASTVEGNSFVIVNHVQNVSLQINLFDEVSGRSEECDLTFSVSARHEFGSGVIVVRSELDSERHTSLITKLLQALRG
jgi:hypothetical protein